jgi:hypothetical protein
MKLKRGTEHKLNGSSVWVELDSGGDNVFICYQKTRDVTKGDTFEWVVREELTENKKYRTSEIKRTVNPGAEKINEKAKLNEFYLQLSYDMPFNCQECGKPLYAYNTFAKRSVSAHILPKSLFPSIATNPDNIIFLGAGFLTICWCHDNYDNLGAKERSEMKIYPLVIERYQTKLKHLLTPAEQVKAEKYLGLTV